MHTNSIRLAQAVDQEAVVACVQEAYTKYIVRLGKEPAPLLTDYKALIAQKVVYVLISKEEMLGVLVLMPQERSMFVEARQEHLNEIRLYTNELMTENLHFYQMLGFEEEGRKVQDGYRRVFLRKALSSKEEKK